MSKYKTVDEFLSDQTPDKLEQINKLRNIIIKAESALEENLKWNAPNYVYDGQDRITFNLKNKERKVQLILHMGATKKEDKKAEPILKNDEGLVRWNSNIRGIIEFENLADITAKRHLLIKVIKNWLAIPI